jgi:hypothetical protein
MATKTAEPIASEPDPGTEPTPEPTSQEGNGAGYIRGYDPDRLARVDAMGKLMRKGNASLAGALVDADDGVLPQESERLLTLVIESSAIESKALSKYLKLHSKLRPQLEAAYQEYYRHRQRTARLVDRVVDDAIPGTS